MTPSPSEKQPVMTTRPDGTREWFRDGWLHRDDGPAVESPNGAREWYRDGLRHRDDGPAIEYPDGTRIWYCDGKRHRDGGPAVEFPDGRNEWWRDGKQIDPPTAPPVPPQERVCLIEYRIRVMDPGPSTTEATLNEALLLVRGTLGQRLHSTIEREFPLVAALQSLGFVIEIADEEGNPV